MIRHCEGFKISTFRNSTKPALKFIPAKESALFKKSFGLYVRLLFKYRFKKVWIHQKYQPARNARSVYFLNHTSWWDGLIPLLLNQTKFQQQARALMELEQMQNYPFFKWLGTFSIDTEDRAHTLTSLRYAVDSMQRRNASLFIYPEGEIRPASIQKKFAPGIGWLYSQLSEADFVPAGIHIHTVRSNKPELHIWVDEPMELENGLERQQITRQCELKMESVLENLLQTAGFDDTIYEPI